MPVSLVVLLLAVVVLGLGVRVGSPWVPLRAAARIGPVDAGLVVVGLLGLLLHCTAMFFPAVVLTLPGTDPVVGAINALGAASVLWYVVPVLLVMAGLRRVPAPAMIGLTVLFGAVGLTMYDGGPVGVHLATIATTVLALVIVLVALVRVRPASAQDPT